MHFSTPIVVAGGFAVAVFVVINFSAVIVAVFADFSPVADAFVLTSNPFFPSSNEHAFQHTCSSFRTDYCS